MAEAQRATGKSAAWGVVAGISGSGAFGIWIAAATSGTAFPIWPAWALGILTVGATYMSFTPIRGIWPFARPARSADPSAATATRSRANLGLSPERDGDHFRLLLHNHGKPAECSVQVIAIRDPLGRVVGPQHWTIRWLDDWSTDPKRVLRGQTLILDFAGYDRAAVQAEIQGGHGGGPHWRFPAAPNAIEARYYNLRSIADLEEQRFTVTVRLLDARSRSFADYDLTLGASEHKLTCEIIPHQQAS